MIVTKASHPELAVEKKTDSPDEDKSVGDASSLIPVLIPEMKVPSKKLITMLMATQPA